MRVRYRTATANDAAAIADLHARSWRATYRGIYLDEYLDGPLDEDRLEVWTARLSEPAQNQFVAVAEDRGRVVGFACVYGGHHKVLGSFLDNIHTDPDLHGQGIGTGLVRAVVAWCTERYPDVGLYLKVVGSNVNARRFYERLGATDRGGGAASNPWAVDGLEVRMCAWPSLDAVSRGPE